MKMNTSTTFTERDALKLRVMKAKAKLPKAYMVLFRYFYPEIDTNKSLETRIFNTMSMRALSEEIVIKVEHVAEAWRKRL